MFINPPIFRAISRKGYSSQSVATLVSVLLLLCYSGFPQNVWCQRTEEESLQEVTVVEIIAPRALNSAPLSTYLSPVSSLEYNSAVDLQSRNLPEAQGDLSIRGGLFTNSGFQIESANIFDPQTGHYYAEIPVSSFMLSEAEVSTGIENSLSGFNSATGTIHYLLKPIEPNLALKAGMGSRELNFQSLYAGYQNIVKSSEDSLNLDLAFDRSKGEGTQPNGDHQFYRLSGRLQWETPESQTDLLYGYQSKFFSWPYLYALKELHKALETSGIESEDLETHLVLLNHRAQYQRESFWTFSTYFRHHEDNYELDRFNPGLFNPYEHTTKVISSALAGRHLFEEFALNYSVQLLADEIASTALTFGPFSSRSYIKLSLLPEKSFSVSPDKSVIVQAGLSSDYSNRDSSELSPLFKVAYRSNTSSPNINTYYFQYTQTTQLPEYTALAANPEAGLFRGNSSLEREISKNLEIGLNLDRQDWTTSLALFYRFDRELVDWIYDSSLEPFSARSATNLDLDTFGVETSIKYQAKLWTCLFGYNFLHKTEDYPFSGSTKSFYALNFPKHRLVANIAYSIPRLYLSFGINNEFRVQEPNELRTGEDHPFFSSLQITWHSPFYRQLYLTVTADNIGNENFEEVPGVPGRRRLISANATLRW